MGWNYITELTTFTNLESEAPITNLDGFTWIDSKNHSWGNGWKSPFPSHLKLVVLRYQVLGTDDCDSAPQEFSQVVSMLLTRDAEKRPSAEELLRRASFRFFFLGWVGGGKLVIDKVLKSTLSSVAFGRSGV